MKSAIRNPQSQIDGPLRILMVSRQFWPVAHGAENQFLRLARSLRARGHQVQVLSARLDPSWPKTEILPGDVPLTRLPSPRLRGWGSVRFLASLATYLIRHRKRFDVVHINALKYAAALGGFLGPKLGLPVLARSICAGSVGDMAHLNTLPFPKPVLRYLHRLDRVIALSRELSDELAAHGFAPRRIALIPNGIDDAEFRPPTPQERETARQRLPVETEGRLVAVTTARLTAQKGAQFLLQAFERPEVRARWTWIVLGDGELRPALESDIRRAGLESSVRLMGRIEDVKPWLHAADLFCLPSLAEGQSNSLIEAMACGLPSLATRVSGTVDLIADDEQGLLVDPARPDQLADGLIRLTDDARRERMGTAARRRVEETCALEIVTRRYENLYREMIAEKRAAHPPGR
ncbi:glycosyltransferase family 4 protein [Candidatus Sumerlaeota bacterium]|nr:glycosyltransferase family 4 protein [Candidatus Sumerlaeota bacterium]